VQWRQRQMAAGYAAWLVLLAVAYYLMPGLRPAAWSLLGLTGVAGLVAGVLLHRPAGRAPWLLPQAVQLAVRDGRTLRLISAPPWLPPGPPELAPEAADAWLAALHGRDPELRPAAGYGGPPAGAVGADHVLLSPLSLTGWPTCAPAPASTRTGGSPSAGPPHRIHPRQPNPARYSYRTG
jgi:hypothetical protein